MDHIVNQTTIFDKWNENVEDGLMQDYPWYMYYKKLQHYAEYKVSNYKLAYLENDLQLNDRDYLYLKTGENGDIIDVPNYYYDSIIYGQQSFNPNESNQEFLINDIYMVLLLICTKAYKMRISNLQLNGL